MPYKTFKRYTFNFNNYIRYRDVINNFGRKDYIFVYEQAHIDERCIFLILTKVAPTKQTITYLKVLIIEDSKEFIIIGLLTLQINGVYIIDISKFKDRKKRDYLAYLGLGKLGHYFNIDHSSLAMSVYLFPSPI